MPEEPLIQEMNTDAEIISAFATLHELRPHLREEEFLATVRRMQKSDGYRLAAVLEGDGEDRVVMWSEAP